jgi:hypothetical protein
MCRRFATSLLFFAGLLAVAAAQPPGTDKKIDPTADKADPAIPQAKKPDPTDVAVNAALVNDPDVKVARAKVQLAEAELTKAKQAVVLKVLTLKASIGEHERAVRSAQDRVAWAARTVEKGIGDQRQLLDERAKLESAQAALAKAETELKLLTGSDRLGPVADLLDVTNPNQAAVLLGLKWLAAQQWSRERDYAASMYLAQLAWLESHTVKGPVPDRIRAALDKPVKLGAKGEKVTYEKALEVFKSEAGLDVPVRGSYPKYHTLDNGEPLLGTGGKPEPITLEIVSQGEELPVGAWFQMLEDNSSFRVGGKQLKWRFYVREYGILFVPTEAAPPDAPTLTEFWKQKPAAKKETTAEPKPK